MEFLTLTGRNKKLSSLKKYIINWDDKSRSKFQKNVKDFLYYYWRHDIVFEEFPLAGTRQKFDFYNFNKKTIIEVQGAQHQKHVKHFHGESVLGWVRQIKKDVDKIKFCKLNDIKFFEIFPEDDISRKCFEEKGIPLI